jgi:hypothetical protein
MLNKSCRADWSLTVRDSITSWSLFVLNHGARPMESSAVVAAAAATTATAVVGIVNGTDVANLRRAIGAVHCLQRERGASSVGVVAAPVTRSSARIQQRMKLARTMTDQALRPLRTLLQQERKTLDRIRAVVDDAVTTDSATRKPSFHRILALYNTLIQSILHLLVWKYTKRSKTGGAKEREDNGASAVDNNMAMAVNNNNMKRSESHSALADWHRRNGAMASQQRLRRQKSNGVSDLLLSSSDPQASSSMSRYSFTNGLVPDPPMSLAPMPSSADGAEEEEAEEYFDESHGSCSGDGSLSVPCESHNEIVARLLWMLDTFVRLKESIGVERATLSSILLVDQEDNRFMLNDLVLEVAAQKRHHKILSTLTCQAGDLQHLVEELVALSPTMQQLQQKILERYDVKKLKLDFHSHRELWNLLTLYMDKLHSLELMIVEEIGFWAADDDETSSSKNRPVRETVEGVLSLPRGCSEQELFNRLASRSAESVKNNLMAALEKTTALPLRATSAVSLQLDEVPSPEKRMLDDAAAKEWEIGIYEIQFSRRIGEGSAGTTYLATWCGLEVAVKVASINDMGLEGWQTEVQALQRLHHPNIIRLLGCVHRENPMTFCLVLEYCTLGDLEMVLRKETPASFFSTVAVDVAKGMSYLHRRGIMHRDIKPSNILLHGTFVPGGFVTKLTDFGMALELSITGDRTAETGTYRWMAPYVFLPCILC